MQLAVQKGFTLIEILIAIAILAVIATQSYSGLANMIKQKQIISQNHQKITQLQRAIFIMERDFMQIAPRSIRNEIGSRIPAMLVEKSLVEFTRAGRPNLSNTKKSIFLRVAYKLEQENLIRVIWPVVNRSSYTKANTTILIKGVTDFALKLKYKNWRDDWPPPAISILLEDKANTTLDTILPHSIRFDITISGLGTITRIIPAIF